MSRVSDAEVEAAAWAWHHARHQRNRGNSLLSGLPDVPFEGVRPEKRDELMRMLRPALEAAAEVREAAPADTEAVTRYEQVREIVGRACVAAIEHHGIGTHTELLARVLAEIDALRPASSTEGGEE